MGRKVAKQCLVEGSKDTEGQGPINRAEKFIPHQQQTDNRKDFPLISGVKVQSAC